MSSLADEGLVPSRPLNIQGTDGVQRCGGRSYILRGRNLISGAMVVRTPPAGNATDRSVHKVPGLGKASLRVSSFSSLFFRSHDGRQLQPTSRLCPPLESSQWL
ncbi:hypothetical protein VUR80DRAFT_5762 [Thermomyces stellatus]